MSINQKGGGIGCSICTLFNNEYTCMNKEHMSNWFIKCEPDDKFREINKLLESGIQTSNNNYSTDSNEKLLSRLRSIKNEADKQIKIDAQKAQDAKAAQERLAKAEKARQEEKARQDEKAQQDEKARQERYALIDKLITKLKATNCPEKGEFFQIRLEERPFFIYTNTDPFSIYIDMDLFTSDDPNGQKFIFYVKRIRKYDSGTEYMLYVSEPAESYLARQPKSPHHFTSPRRETYKYTFFGLNDGTNKYIDIDGFEFCSFREYIRRQLPLSNKYDITYHSYQTKIYGVDDTKVTDYTSITADKKLDLSRNFNFILYKDIAMKTLKKYETVDDVYVVSIKTPKDIRHLYFGKIGDFYYYEGYQSKSIIKLIQEILKNEFNDITPINYSELATSVQILLKEQEQKKLEIDGIRQQQKTADPSIEEKELKPQIRVFDQNDMENAIMLDKFVKECKDNISKYYDKRIPDIVFPDFSNSGFEPDDETSRRKTDFYKFVLDRGVIFNSDWYSSDIKNNETKRDILFVLFMISVYISNMPIRICESTTCTKYYFNFDKQKRRQQRNEEDHISCGVVMYAILRMIQDKVYSEQNLEEFEYQLRKYIGIYLKLYSSNPIYKEHLDVYSMIKLDPSTSNKLVKYLKHSGSSANKWETKYLKYKQKYLNLKKLLE